MKSDAGEAQPGCPVEAKMSPHIDANTAGDGTTSSSNGSDEVMDLLAQVESQFDRIRSLRRDQDDVVRDLTTRSEELEQAESRLQQREIELQDEFSLRDDRRRDEIESHLAALQIASLTIARRGRRLRELDAWMERAQLDRRRMRRRLKGMRHALRRLLREHEEVRIQHDEAEENRASDRNTIEQQEQRLSIAASKIRQFSELLQEQTDRMEEGAAAMVEAEKLRSRIRRLEAELIESRNRPSSEEPVVVEVEVEVPAEADPAATAHLQRRRSRLARFRHLLREQARRLPQVAQLEAARRRQETQLMEQQHHLDEVRRVLTASEERMIRKWAASRAIHVTGWIILLMMLLGAGSWLAADTFDPPSMRSTVVVQPAVPADQTVAPEVIEHWKNWHIDLVESEGFPRKLARRYTEQTGIAIDPQLVQRRIEQVMETNGTETDGIQFSMVGRSGDGTRDWLDAFARTLVSESARTARSRPNPILAQVRNRYTESGRERLARSEGRPIDDTRLRSSLLVFGIAMIACLIIGIVVFSRLTRANRLVDDPILESTLLLSD